jgi:uncharacterized protein YegP (UPF0339 family)
MSKLEVHKDKAGEFRSRFRASNGEVMFDSEGYSAKASALKSCEFSLKRDLRASASYAIHRILAMIFCRNTSAGVLKPRHLRGVEFNLSQIAFRSRSVMERGSTSRGSHLRARPLVFSTVPFCQGDCGAQYPRRSFNNPPMGSAFLARAAGVIQSAQARGHRQVARR